MVATIYSLVFAGLLVNGVYLISAEGAKLETTKTQISEHAAKEIAYTRMVDLLESTKEDRATLQQFFITENDTISFLATIEDAAKKNSIELKTNELAVIPGTTKDSITTPPALAISFSFAGSEVSVKKFLRLLESIPYHTEIPKVTLAGSGSGEEWTGSAQLRLTIKP